MSPTLRIAVVGAGLIGRQHARRVMNHPRMELACVVDPYLDPEEAAFGPDTVVTADLEEALDEVDGVIFATPNALHRDGALAAITAGVPALVEEPIADTIKAAEQIVTAAEATDVPVLIGHHRRHSPLLAAAAQAIASGAIGEPVAVMGSALFHKPDDYFDSAPWRRQTGGGPILINLIHDIDDLRTLCGEIVRVQATTSNTTRGFQVEDTAAITLTFANGALGTFIVSDTAASARSWEQTSRENPSYAAAPDEDCYHIAGTRGSLSIPTLRLRTYQGKASWWEPFTTTALETHRDDPLQLQLEHFEQVIWERVTPLVTARDSPQSLRVIHAVFEAARTGLLVEVPLDLTADHHV